MGLNWKPIQIAIVIIVCLTFTTRWLQAQEQDITLTVIESAFCEAAIVEGATEACIAFAECLSDLLSDQRTCEPQYTEAMLMLCEAAVCEDDILFNLALTVVAAEHFLDGYQQSDFQNSLIDALVNYDIQDDAVVLAVLSRLVADYGHRYLPYASGLVYARGGLIDQALESYDRAEAIQFFTPLVYYSRGHLYATTDDLANANRDFYTFKVFQEALPSLAALSVPSVAAADVLAGSDNWMLYPLATYGVSPMGESERNLFHQPAREIEVVPANENGVIAVAGIFDNDIFWERSLPPVLFFDCEGAVCNRAINFQKTYLGLNAGGGYLEFTWDEDIAWMSLEAQGSESLSETRYVVLSTSVPDPRPEVSCLTGGYSRLQAGDTAFSAFGFIQVYEAPDDDSSIVFQGRLDLPLTITSDLTCNDRGNWFMATLPDGTTGWVREAIDGDYELVPDRELPPLESLLTLP